MSANNIDNIFGNLMVEYVNECLTKKVDPSLLEVLEGWIPPCFLVRGRGLEDVFYRILDAKDKECVARVREKAETVERQQIARYWAKQEVHQNRLTIDVRVHRNIDTTRLPVLDVSEKWYDQGGVNGCTPIPFPAPGSCSDKASSPEEDFDENELMATPSNLAIPEPVSGIKQYPFLREGDKIMYQLEVGGDVKKIYNDAMTFE